MNVFLAVLSGALIAVMILVNGGLTGLYGNPLATVIIHIVGLCCITAVLLVRRARFPKGPKIPWYLFSGGAVGVALTYCNNITINAIGVSATLAIGLLGQVLSSLLIEQWGWFKTPVRPISPQKLLVVGLILAGIVVMRVW